MLAINIEGLLLGQVILDERAAVDLSQCLLNRIAKLLSGCEVETEPYS
jgi:hypothetical protein